MPSILETGNQAVKDSVKAELDQVAKNKLRVEAGLDGNITGAISTTRKGLTFTAYVKALITGPQKLVSGGVRVEKDF
jgi:hypothetical protein